MSHAFDVNNGDDSDNESDNECGEDEEMSHFVGSKNIGAAHEKNNQDNLEQAYIALWEDKIVQVYIRLLFEPGKHCLPKWYIENTNDYITLMLYIGLVFVCKNIQFHIICSLYYSISINSTEVDPTQIHCIMV